MSKPDNLQFLIESVRKIPQKKKLTAQEKLEHSIQKWETIKKWAQDPKNPPEQRVKAEKAATLQLYGIVLRAKALIYDLKKDGGGKKS